jgi:hypothetical protein
MRGGKLVRVAFLVVIAVGIAKLVAALRGPKAPQFARHPTIDGGPTATPDGPLLPPTPASATAGSEEGLRAESAHEPIAELASPPGPDGVLADPRRDLAGELAAPEPTPELAAPASVEALAADSSDVPPRADEAARRWVEPVEGACPEGFAIKAKMRSGIYHEPGALAYERTKPDRCYASAADAEADGLRPPKR